MQRPIVGQTIVFRGLPGCAAAVPRRTFLNAALFAAAGAAVSCGRAKSTRGWRFFTDDEARTVEAVTAQLIPADGDPGAKEAGAVDYIDIQLSTRFKKHRKVYREGLAALDAASRASFGKRFVELTDARQVEALNSTEERDKVFFNLILSHTRQGFYGDPRHGGNRNRTSWKMLRLATPPVRGRQHYESERTG
jgi:gluconate 2-dehydrogenase gamma chain